MMVLVSCAPPSCRIHIFLLHQIGGAWWRYYLRVNLLFLDMSTKLHLRIHQPPSQIPPTTTNFTPIFQSAPPHTNKSGVLHQVRGSIFFTPPNWWRYYLRLNLLFLDMSKSKIVSSNSTSLHFFINVRFVSPPMV